MLVFLALLAAITFASIKSQIDRGAAKYEETCQKRGDFIHRPEQDYRRVVNIFGDFNLIHGLLFSCYS